MNFKAFTLMELLLVMAITAIVVYLSFFLLEAMQLQLKQYMKHNDMQEGSRRCITLMIQDNARAKYVLYENDRLLFVRGRDTVSYRFGEVSVVRSYGAAFQDTFKTHVILKGTNEMPLMKKPLIKQFELQIADTNFPKDMVLEKVYSTKDLLIWNHEH